MDTELFMECEEEELEPWQQVDDSVEEDDVDFMTSYCEPLEDSLSPLPVSETPPPPPVSSSMTPARTGSSHTGPSHIGSSHVGSSLTGSSHAGSSLTGSSHAGSPTVAPPPSIVTSSSTPIATAPPLMAQAPPLILTQTAGGTFLLPAATGAGNAPPILLTTQGFPVMNHGAPLLLNLQPGQTVQPLTLIQSSSLGHLVRPSVGVVPILPQAQARPGPAPPRGPAHPGSTFTTFTFHTSTPGPVNLQTTQMGGASALKLAGCPALPSGSANGVTRVAAFSPPGPAPSTTPTASVTPDPPRVVMSVEEFYYGTVEGDLSLRAPPPLGVKSATFTCQICAHLAENNLRLMQHMLQHSDLVGAGAGSGDQRRCCRFCYRQFSSPAQLQSHQQQVHGSVRSSSMCRICEWAFENEPAFLNHMKSNHKPGEMPYACQVCLFRSSFYSDVLQHFASFHRDSRFLLCVFCLKVTRNQTTYQQHLMRHQVNQAFHCNRCRLQFVFLKDKMQHKLENHRSFHRPAQLEGLPPGSKVTIRTFGKSKPAVTSSGGRLLQSPSPLIQPINIKSEQQRSPIQTSPTPSRSPRSQMKKLFGRRVTSRFSNGERLLCLECGTDASDFSAHYPTHVRCLLCPYSSCCSRAYASHMIHHHVSQSRDKDVPLHRLPPPCRFLLRCSDCGFRSPSGDHMARHLLLHPEHHSATCCPRTLVEPDIRFYHSEDQDPVRDQDLLDPAWMSADSWQPPSESGGPVVSFSQSGGPRQFMAKNSDAIDFFNLLFPAKLVELITSETNAHVKTSRFLGSCEPDWAPVTTHEVKGFIGLVILMGIQNLPDPAHYWSWCHYDNSYTFYRAMSYKRFKQISANIRMGSFTTEEHRGTGRSHDSLHILRPMLELLDKAMWDAYQPNCSLTIDRALLPSLEEEDVHSQRRTQPQLWLLCDSKSGYCHRFFIPEAEKVPQELGFMVVPELVKGLEDKHHHLYLASPLTSVPLMQKLLDQGIYASSSFPPPNPILPRGLWDQGRLDKPGDFLQWQFGPLLATRWRDTKEMGCLSTNAAPGEKDTVWRRSQTKVGELDPIDRPMTFCLLQDNMRGVDICKQLLACNPLGGISQDRHWRSLFWFLVNLSIVNAFIVLRESRRDNPPAWVQDGLFTQVNFRKRLGNQLAKCAQKYMENIEMAGSRGPRVAVAEETSKQRHKMAKISNISKRCKTCTLKNVRRESVYGCSACKVSLCKQPSCFWDFHGLAPLNRGSTKVGFIKDKVTGAIEFSTGLDTVDDAMAPVEDLDFSNDECLDELDDIDEEEAPQDDFYKEAARPLSRHPSAAISHTQPMAILSSSRDRDDSLTARQLRIAMFALCDGLHQASRMFLTDVQLVLSWLKEARKRLRWTDQDGCGDGEEQMVAWVLSMREQQLPITESSFFHKASTLKKKGSFSNSFRISYDWAVSFLLRHRLAAHRHGREATLSRTLPPFLDAKVHTFREFTQKLIRANQMAANAVAAMDELSLFVDFRLVLDRARRSGALELSGSTPLVTVYLAVLSDGTMLPSLVLANRHLAGKVLPEFVLLETSPESPSAEEALDIWTNKVWLQHVSSSLQTSRSVLVLDRHQEHCGDSFLASISGSRTLPAVIPGGCSSSTQPLDVCMKPVLQRFLLSRWERFTAADAEQLDDMSLHQLQEKVARLLLDWVVEALTLLNQLPQLWRTSFHLSGILPQQREGDEEEGTARQKPEEVQLDLLQTLTEILLGTEALKDNSELLDLDDEEEEEDRKETEEDRKETEEDRKETKEDRKETEEDRKEMKEDRKETEEDRKETEEDRKETEEDRKETEEDRKETEEDRKETEEDRKETKEDRKEDRKEMKETKEDGKEMEEDRKETEEDRKEMEEDRKEDRREMKEDGKEMEEDRKETEEDRKEMEEDRKETEEDRKETEEDRKETKEDRKETEEDRKETKEDRKETEEDRKEMEEDRKEEGKEMKEDRKETEKETKPEEDSEEEGKEAGEDRRDVSWERRETRIVTGEEVGDEWKLTVTSRTDETCSPGGPR
ncbi:uncharacterized protein V6R79_009531 [Siganus canaliculatus]